MTHRPWTRADDDRVRTLPPVEAAAATGRTLAAVYRRRCRLGLSAPKGERAWSPTEDQVVRTLPPQAASAATGRSVSAVYARRVALGVTAPRPPWTPAEDRLVRGGKPREVRADLPHRSIEAIYRRRAQLRRSGG